MTAASIHLLFGSFYACVREASEWVDEFAATDLVAVQDWLAREYPEAAIEECACVGRKGKA